eukprot:6205721-Pleurochrysis_carterae.AAC.1
MDIFAAASRHGQGWFFKPFRCPQYALHLSRVMARIVYSQANHDLGSAERTTCHQIRPKRKSRFKCEAKES